MSAQYFFQGFRSRTSAEDEDAKIYDSSRKFPTLGEAAAKARECFEKDGQLGLAVIFRENPVGEHEGVKFVFRDKEGEFEEGDLYWGNWECCET